MPSRHGQVDDRTADAGLTEPMALYLSYQKEVETLYTLPDDRKLVPVVIVGPDREIPPSARRTVWPMACAAS